MFPEPAVRAVEFESREAYRSSQTPGYTSWVSFFPGQPGQWYLTCEEVTRPARPLPRCTRQQWFEMSLPVGYDKSQYCKEMVILESDDEMKTWKVVLRQSGRYHHSAGQFGTARTQDGRFLRFMWSCYSLDPTIKRNEIFFTSDDDGKTWRKEAPFHDERFISYAHRLRRLHDGTFVLAVATAPAYGSGTDRPVRATIDLNAVNETQMMLYFSYDDGRSWDGPLPILAGQTVSETDFVELPEGDLLVINNSIFPNPGRQFVYRNGRSWTPMALERAMNARGFLDPLPPGAKRSDVSVVPETVCLTEDGILVGCMRCSNYQWSDDLGLTWWPLDGAPDLTPEMYQPWIHCLGDGRIVCAGHYGTDDAIGTRDQYVVLHSFRLEVSRKTKGPKIDVERDFDEDREIYPNAYTLTLTADGVPLPDREIEFWFVERYKPGYDSWNTIPLEERMQMGGKLIKVRTRPDGKARVELPELDSVEDPHRSYQFVARFNIDRSDLDCKPSQTPQFEMYCLCRQDPSLESAT